ncbi:MAG: AI-2E family transporter [Actinobacteria bacterium]|nr:AI-2E family transporter [Actinomycetota bacterium]
MRIKKPANKLDTVKKLGIYSWSVIGLLIIISLVLYFLYRIRIALIPVILAIGIAYLLGPFVDWMSKKMKRVFALIIAYTVFTGFVFVIFFFTIPMIIDQFNVFITRFPLYIKNVTEMINNFIETNALIDAFESATQKEVLPLDTNAITTYVINTFGISSSNFLQSATVFTRSFVNIIITIIIGPLLGIYILKDSQKLRSLFIKVLPARAKYQTSVILDRINNVGGRYIRGQILISIIVGVLCTVILLLLKVDFAILLGFTAGVLNLIPFLGPILGAIPAALTALFISPLKALLVVLLFIAVQQLDNYVISPNIMKYQVGIHPAIVIFALIAAGALIGPWGLLIAVPTTAVFQSILKYYLLERKNIRSR